MPVSCVAPAKPSKPISIQLVVRPNTGERHATDSTGSGSEERPPRGVGGKRVEAEKGDSVFTSSSAGAEIRASSTSSRGQPHGDDASAFVRRNLDKIGSAEVEKDQIAVEVSVKHFFGVRGVPPVVHSLGLCTRQVRTSGVLAGAVS